jgi:hypothetical protein
MQLFRLAGILALSLLPRFGVPAFAQTGSPPPVVTTSHLVEGTVTYRLVPIAGAKMPGTRGWSIQRSFIDVGSTAAVLQVITVNRREHLTVDSTLFARATLRPIWEHVHGATTSLLAFDGTRVTGTVARGDSSRRAITFTTMVPAFSSSTDDMVVQSLPFAEGYQVVLPFMGEDDVEQDTIRVRRREPVKTTRGVRDAWTVDLLSPGSTETLWIDSSTRAILRHVYTFTAAHSQYELVRSPQGTGR